MNTNAPRNRASVRRHLIAAAVFCAASLPGCNTFRDTEPVREDTSAADTAQEDATLDTVEDTAEDTGGGETDTAVEDTSADDTEVSDAPEDVPPTCDAFALESTTPGAGQSVTGVRPGEALSLEMAFSCEVSVEAVELMLWGHQCGLHDDASLDVQGARLLATVPADSWCPGERIDVLARNLKSTTGETLPDYQWHLHAPVALANAPVTWTESWSWTDATAHSLDVALGDVDGDGDLDAIVANKESSCSGGACNADNWVLIGQGDGTFLDPVSIDDSDTRPSLGVVLFDSDNDGDLDVWATNEGTNPDAFYTNITSAPNTPAFSPKNLTDTDAGVSAAASDLDNDGDLDIVVANWANNINRTYINDGGNSFIQDKNVGREGTTDVAVGDLDGDGLPDLVFANLIEEANALWYNDPEDPGNFDGTADLGGDGVRDPDALLAAGSSTRATAVADFNNDGRLDILFANESDQANLVYLSDGTGFVVNAPLQPSSSTRDLAIGDLDGDGDFDAVFTTATSTDSSETWLWKTDTFVLDTGANLDTASARGIDLGDLDGDGDLDAFVTTDGKLQVFLNQSVP